MENTCGSGGLGTYRNLEELKYIMIKSNQNTYSIDSNVYYKN